MRSNFQKGLLNNFLRHFLFGSACTSLLYICASKDDHRPKHLLKRSAHDGTFSLFEHSAVTPILIVNSLVFGAWHIKPLSGVMARYFSHSVTSHYVTGLTAVFSHRSFMHLAMNMAALISFGDFIASKIGHMHFWAFYMTSGLVSSIGSHAWRLLWADFTPSIGASGAIYSLLGASAHFPDLKVHVIFFPFASVPINYAFGGLLCTDIYCLLRRFSRFDHAAHISGGVFGFYYSKAILEQSKARTGL